MTRVVLIEDSQLLAIVKAGLEHDDAALDQVVQEVIDGWFKAGNIEDARQLAQIFKDGKKKRDDKRYADIDANRGWENFDGTGVQGGS